MTDPRIRLRKKELDLETWLDLQAVCHRLVQFVARNAGQYGRNFRSKLRKIQPRSKFGNMNICCAHVKEIFWCLLGKYG